MRRPISVLALGLAVSLIPAVTSQAQTLSTFADPFTFYYGYYLPHQMYVAAQPTPLDTINAVTAQRQVNALTDRAGLYDPISPFGEEDLDPLRPYSPRSQRRQRAMNPAANFNARGTGPATFYNRTAQYYPGLRTGRGPNRNIAVMRNARMGGGYNIPSASQMSAGPR